MENESRRKLLKALAVSGGAIVAGTVLPTSWIRPIVELGVLPAHAQLSGAQTYSISGCSITRAEERGSFTEVDFSFLVSLNPPGPITFGGTIAYQLTFLPSATVMNRLGLAVIDAGGNGTFIMSGPVPPNGAANITGETSVTLRIQELSPSGSFEEPTSSCTVGPEPISGP